MQHEVSLYWDNSEKMSRLKKRGYCYETKRHTYYRELKKNLVEMKKNIWFVTGSKFEGHMIENLVIREKWVPAEKVLFINAKSDPEKKQLLRNLNLLTQYQLVIVTPVITVGSDFTARHFHVCFAFSTSYTTDFEQIFQTIGRVRDLIDQHVHLYIGHNCVDRAVPTTLDKVKSWFKSKREANKWVECILLRRDSTENIMTKEGVSEWLVNVYFQNKLHSNSRRLTTGVPCCITLMRRNANTVRCNTRKWRRRSSRRLKR